VLQEKAVKQRDKQQKLLQLNRSSSTNIQQIGKIGSPWKNDANLAVAILRPKLLDFKIKK
jgi:hypothetical protein